MYVDVCFTKYRTAVLCVQRPLLGKKKTRDGAKIVDKLTNQFRPGEGALEKIEWGLNSVVNEK